MIFSLSELSPGRFLVTNAINDLHWVTYGTRAEVLAFWRAEQEKIVSGAP